MNNQISIVQVQSKFLSRVYSWMSFGLILTAITAFYVANNPLIVHFIYGKNWIFFSLLIIKFVMCVTISSALDSISARTAKWVFLAYSILTGIMLSVIFFVYPVASIAKIFFIASSMFASLAIYGHFTKSDLSGMGTFLFMSLIGLIISQFFGWFLNSPEFDWVTSGIGVMIFSLLTAYDTQKIKNMAQEVYETNDDYLKLSIYGALQLYLDFINLFLYLLSFIYGKKKN